MSIGIKGARIENLSLGRNDQGESEITGTYSLISTIDKVLAKQQINGYGGMKIVPSASTIKALDCFLAAYKADLNMVLGLEEQ